MPSYIVERSTPISTIKDVVITKDIIGHNTIDNSYLTRLTSDTDLYAIANNDFGIAILTTFFRDTIIKWSKSVDGDLILHINDKNEIFDTLLKYRNFYVQAKLPGDTQPLITINYNLKPSTAVLDNIGITTTHIDGNRIIGGKGEITNSGVCELWSDYEYGVFKTEVKRLFYNNEEIDVDEVNGDNFLEKLDYAKENGGGIINVKSTIQTRLLEAINFNYNGIFVKVIQNENNDVLSPRSKQINFIGADSSIVIDGWNDNGRNIDGKLLNPVYNFYGASPIFTNCRFSNCKFVFYGPTSVSFNNCKFKNCSIVTDTAGRRYAEIDYDIKFTNCSFDGGHITGPENFTAGGQNPNAKFYQCDFKSIEVKYLTDAKLYTCRIYGNTDFKNCYTSLFENCTFEKKQVQTSQNNAIVISGTDITLRKSFSVPGTLIALTAAGSDLWRTFKFSCFNCTFYELHIDKANMYMGSNSTFALSNCTITKNLSFEGSPFYASTLYACTVLTDNIEFKNNCTTIVNSLILHTTTDQTLKGTVNVISGTDYEHVLNPSTNQYEYSSYVKYIDESECKVLCFSNENYPYKHLNNAIKCLQYELTEIGISRYNLLNLYLNNMYYISNYITDYDIFGNMLGEEPTYCGCENAYAGSINGMTIELDYRNTNDGLTNFKYLLGTYRAPQFEKEFISFYNAAKFTWLKDDEEITTNIKFFDDYSVCIYKISEEDNNKTLICRCEYENEILETSIVLAVAEVPTISYEKTKYVAWTDNSLNISAFIKTNNTNLENQTQNITAKWYIKPDMGASFPYKDSYILQYQEDNNLQTILNIENIEKSNETRYYCEISYLPFGFESPRLLYPMAPDGQLAYVSVQVKYRVIVDNELTTTGDINLNVDDFLTLSGKILQGDSPWFEWQKSKNPQLDEWESLYEPTQNLLDYKIRLKFEDKDGTYYRFRAFNYIDDNDHSLGIATEDFSQPNAKIIIFPKIIKGDEISSSVVLFKIALKDLAHPSTKVVSANHNYRRFETIDNVDYVDAKEQYFPTIHRRLDSELLSFNGETGEYEKVYMPYSFPSDIDIDKYNLKFGVASDKLIIRDDKRYGGKLYILELENLNDKIDFKINKPKAVYDIVDVYNQTSMINDNTEWESIGDSIYARNNFIAVADPNARVSATNTITEFDTFFNPRLYSSGNKTVWDIKIREQYIGVPFMQLLEINNNIAIADIQYIPEKLLIRVTFENETSYIAENQFRLNIFGKKPTASHSFSCEINELNPELIKNEDGEFIWTLEIPEIFYGQPLIQISDAEGGLVNMVDIWYSEESNTYTIKFDINEPEIQQGRFKATLLGKNKEHENTDMVLVEKHENYMLWPIDNQLTWKIKFENKFKTAPLIQLYNIADDKLVEHITDIAFDETNTSVTITFDLDYVIQPKTMCVNLIGEKFDYNSIAYETTKDNCGRVLLFTYNGNTGLLKLVKVIRAPLELKEAYFGQTVEFDDHGNIIISAPGEIQQNFVNYIEKDTDIIPAIKSDNSLRFDTRGRVYVFSLEKLLNGDVSSYVEPTQILTNKLLFSTVNYNKGSWGDLAKLYRKQSLLEIKDTKTNGQKIHEGFSDMNSYMEYYNFNSTYDFSYKAYFPKPYTFNDFVTNNSNSEHFDIAYRNVYYTNNMDERYGSAISYNNDTLVIGAPYYKDFSGMIETWHYDKTLKRYIFGAGFKNPYKNGEILFGLNVEMGTEYILTTFRKTRVSQAVTLLQYTDNNMIVDNGIVINGERIKDSSGFGNALDSYGYTFVIADTDASKIYRYLYHPNTEGEEFIKNIQTIDLTNFGINSNGTNNIVITHDKILASYNAYGALTDTIVDDDENKILTYGEGAVLQLTLSGGEYKL